MKKVFLGVVVCALLIASMAVFIYRDEIERASVIATLFTGAEQYENFNRMNELLPTTIMTAAPESVPFPQGGPISLPESYQFEEQQLPTDDFLRETDTGALLVVQDGTIQFEQYWLTGGPQVNWLSMSVAKSFISAAIGIAVDEGLIDIEKDMVDYVPSLAGSAYDGARVKDVLQMSSGAAWNEDYGDPESDVMQLGTTMAIGGSMDEFVANIQREWEPGTVNRYNSADTQALGMLLSRATGQSITAYVEEKLWHPLGMESAAYWLIDDHQVEMAFGGLNATARDYAKLGELFRNKGKQGDRQLVSEEWIDASVVPDGSHVMPGVHEDFPLGYGFQWWIPESSEGEYLAIGVYNQFIYINPSRDLVIVKLSAFSDYATSDEESAYREMESIEFFRAIAAQ